MKRNQCVHNINIVKRDEENIETEIVYDLHMNDVFISECRVVIKVTSKDKAELHIIKEE